MSVWDVLRDVLDALPDPDRVVGVPGSLPRPLESWEKGYRTRNVAGDACRLVETAGAMDRLALGVGREALRKLDPGTWWDVVAALSWWEPAGRGRNPRPLAPETMASRLEDFARFARRPEPVPWWPEVADAFPARYRRVVEHHLARWRRTPEETRDLCWSCGRERVSDPEPPPGAEALGLAPAEFPRGWRRRELAPTGEEWAEPRPEDVRWTFRWDWRALGAPPAEMWRRGVPSADTARVLEVAPGVRTLSTSRALELRLEWDAREWAAVTCGLLVNAAPVLDRLYDREHREVLARLPLAKWERVVAILGSWAPVCTGAPWPGDEEALLRLGLLVADGWPPFADAWRRWADLRRLYAEQDREALEWVLPGLAAMPRPVDDGRCGSCGRSWGAGGGPVVPVGAEVLGLRPEEYPEKWDPGYEPPPWLRDGGRGRFWANRAGEALEALRVGAGVAEEVAP